MAKTLFQLVQDAVADGLHGPPEPDSYAIARAVLEAIREPTSEMVEAAHGAVDFYDNLDDDMERAQIRYAWQLAIETALK